MSGTDDTRQRRYWERDHRFRRYDHPVVRRFAQQRLAFLDSWLDLNAIHTALDVGCGDGFSSFYMRQRGPRVTAVDRSVFMLDRHPLRSAGRLAAADVRGLPFRDGAFDLVYAWEVLHHVSTPEDVVAEMARVSRRWVLLVEPNRNHPAQFLFALVDPEHRWVLKYTLHYLERAARRAGLRVVRSAVGGWIFPNRTPSMLAPLLSTLPYRSPFGISNWVLGEKS